MIPKTFDQWKHCLIHHCKIDLTKEFAAQRLKIYEDGNHPETLEFQKFYGKEHLNNIVQWFKQIA